MIVREPLIVLGLVLCVPGIAAAAPRGAPPGPRVAHRAIVKAQPAPVEAPPAAEAPAAEATPPAEGTPATPPPIIGYATESGRQLPLLQHAPYQTARLRWTAGFCTTLSGIAVLGTGVGALLLATQARSSLTYQGQNQALATGGVLTGVGAAGTIAGLVVWTLARRDLLRIERGLPQKEAPASSLTPTMSFAPTQGGASFSAGLGGTF